MNGMNGKSLWSALAATVVLGIFYAGVTINQMAVLAEDVAEAQNHPVSAADHRVLAADVDHIKEKVDDNSDKLDEVDDKIDQILQAVKD
jgi:peptidoglycan hydrolase CwlO-like protein